MMVSTLTKKAWNDLSRRKARTVFTMVTVALAVGSMGLLFVSPMMDQAMMEEVEASRLHNVRYMLANASMGDAELEALGAIENVRGVELHTMLVTKAIVGQRLCDVVLIGVPSFRHQQVDLVWVHSGEAPAGQEALSDVQNADFTAFNGNEGDSISILDSSGGNRTLAITGIGRSLQFSVLAQWLGIVLYATSDTVRSLAGGTELTLLELDLRNDGDAETRAAMASVESFLAANQRGAALRSTPSINKDENWPGKEGFGNMMMGFSIITYLALLTAVVLISNTMNTTILEHTREIGCLKSVGATRGQVARVYVTMAALIGAMGSAMGIAIGIILANWMCLTLGPFFGITPGLAIYAPGLALSMAAGTGLSVAAALPALWRGTRLNTREALDEQRISYKGDGSALRALTGSGNVPRTIQMGSRNIGRSSGRSLATTLQLALAVATLLAVASIGSSVQSAISSTFAECDYDIEVTTQGGLGGMDPEVGGLIAAVDGVLRVEAFTASSFKLGKESIAALGLVAGSESHRVRLVQGRWFSGEEAQTAQAAMVVTSTLAQLEGLSVGGRVKAITPAGPCTFEVVGVADCVLQLGRVVFLPIDTMQSLLSLGSNVSGFYVKTVSSDHDLIDSTTASIERSLLESGHLVRGDVMYILERKNISGFMDVMVMIQGLGFIIVLISMVGLANNLTMNVIERTREIGIMRCIGARARSIMAVFSTEGLLLVLAGWAVGVPLGFALGWSLFQMFLSAMAVKMPFVYPLEWLPVALAVVVGVGALVIQAPISRAVRIPPGDALRYQ